MTDERRRFDGQAHLALMRQMGEMQGKLQSIEEKMRTFNDELHANNASVKELQWTLWGGPKESDIGLLEKHRRVARNWAILIALSTFVFSALGRIVSPLYDKAVTDWAYSSPSEKWLRDTQRPKRTHITYRIYHTPPPPPPSDDQSDGN